LRGRCHQSSQDARRSPGGDRRSECHQEAGMLSAAYEARNAESANLDSTLAKRLMDKGIRLRVFARKQMSRTRATHCPGHCTSASVTEGRPLCRLLAFHPLLTCCPTSFIKADSFLRAAGLICGRLPAFFVAGFRVTAGLDPRFRSAHRAFIAAAIRRRAAALIVRFRGPFVSPLFGGRL